LTPLSALPLLYLITSRQTLRPATDPPGADEWQAQLAIVGEAAEAGCPLIQIRERDLPARRLAAFTRAAIAAAHPHGARVLVNDRLDVALATGADGVHLRASSLSAAEARQLTQGSGRREFLIGVSTHSLTEARAAAAGGADFIVCGPVYDTPSKRPYGPPLGLDRLEEVCRAVSLPVLAIGGITLANFRQPLRRGAAGIAAIGLFADRSRLRSNIRLMLNEPETQS
jgi:thiamine-phosphate pyrophosphorylase